MSVNPAKAAELTMEKLSKELLSDINRCGDGQTTGHALWMLTGIKMGFIQHDKAQRWLGYAQGLLVSEREITLEECKAANKESGDF